MMSDSNASIIHVNNIGKYALFCDISEKDFELTKCGYKLFLVVYAVKNLKQNILDRHASISRIFAGGICDLGSNLYNIAYVTTDVRNVQGSMILKWILKQTVKTGLILF